MNTSTASAQVIPDRVSLIIESLDEESAKCGISRDAVKGAAFAALRYNRIEGAEDFENSAFLYVRVTTLALPEGCISTYDVSLRQFDMLPDGQGRYVYGVFEYCSSSGMLSGRDHASRVIAAVKSNVDQCLAKVETSDIGSMDRLLREMRNEAAKAGN